MKYCPYCGTILVDGAVSFCAECGKALPVSKKKEEIPGKSNQAEQRGKSKPQQDIQHEKKSRRRQKREPLSEKEVKEVDMSGKKKVRQPEPLQRPKQQSESPAFTNSIPEDDYDGYYDDVLPVDEGRFNEGLDKELVKKILYIIVTVLLVVGACVMMMYLL